MAPLTNLEQLGVPYKTQNLLRGEMLFWAGDPAPGIFLVLEGSIATMVGTERQIIKLVGEGEFFGYKAPLQDGVQAVSARAILPSKVAVFSSELIFKAVENSPIFIRQLLKQILGDLDQQIHAYRKCYKFSVRERIAQVILLVAEKYGQSTPKGVLIDIPVSRRELALLAGTIDESLARHLADFREEGLIENTRRVIWIKDLAGLRKTASTSELAQAPVTDFRDQSDSPLL